MISLQFKTVIITGAGSGIGQAAAIEFAKLGANIIVNDISDEGIEETVKMIIDAGGNTVGVNANIAKFSEAERLVAKAQEAFGTVDILVNNAGIIRPAMIHKMGEQEWDQVIDVSLKGAFNCIKAVAPIFIERGKANKEAKSNGKIINVTSTAALTGTIGQVNYSAAKAGVMGVTMSVAREWGRYRIQSNAIAFGVVETDMTKTIRDEKFADTYKSKIVLGRFAEVSDVVPGIAFLASAGSDYITGHTLNISGGSYIGY